MTWIFSKLILIVAAAAGFPSHGLSQECYSVWEQLETDIAAADSSGKIFQICPKTTFNLDLFLPPITIKNSNVQLICGPDGKSDDDCIVTGGETQLIIAESAAGVKISGLKFDSAFNVAVSANGGSVSEVTFEDCIWEGNGGLSSLNIEDSTGGEAMTVHLLGCNFNRNANIGAVVKSNGGTIYIRNTFFSENNSGEGVISIDKGGDLTMINNCFLGNSGRSNGTVVLQGLSILHRNDNNFGADNVVNGDCNDIYLDGICEVFSSSDCLSEPMLAPSNTPTLFSGSPSMYFSEVPTSDPIETYAPTLSLVPTDKPTELTRYPSVYPSTGPTQRLTSTILPTKSPFVFSANPTEMITIAPTSHILTDTPTFFRTFSPSNNPTLNSAPTNSEKPTPLFEIPASKIPSRNPTDFSLTQMPSPCSESSDDYMKLKWSKVGKQTKCSNSKSMKKTKTSKAKSAKLFKYDRTQPKSEKLHFGGKTMKILPPI